MWPRHPFVPFHALRNIRCAANGKQASFKTGKRVRDRGEVFKESNAQPQFAPNGLQKHFLRPTLFSHFKIGEFVETGHHFPRRPLFNKNLPFRFYDCDSPIEPSGLFPSGFDGERFRFVLSETCVF